MITEEQLMAYVDGELAHAERERVERAMAEDVRVRDAVAREKQLRQELSGLYDPALEEEVPERLAGLLRGAERRVVPIRKSAPASRIPHRGQFAALAASLVLGLFLGIGVDGLTGGRSVTTAFLPQDQLSRALDVQLASNQGPDAPVQVGISFVGPGGQPCRTFESAEVSGLACRSRGEWRLELIAPGEQSPGLEYQQAGSASALIMSSAQELLTGEPMNAREEKAARDAGWPRLKR
ncbi:anti-sigma factor family protein [Altericroceibacterium xinjiangense]|uniref:anti-sigma factor family protein n=1 Tax=Altericroceibacterium xinjiangense TaxID=762261 RepID=UPI000F7E2B98|nr:zf-HC2 domain-containing protein [Altericroceibacterium xinjiangense]